MACKRVNFNGPRLTSPDVTVEHSTLAFGEPALSFYEEVVASDHHRVEIQVAEPGHWLLRVWLTTTAEIQTDPTLVPPLNYSTAPVFFKVTNASGACTLDIISPTPGNWYVQAAVCGAVSVSDAIVVGV